MSDSQERAQRMVLVVALASVLGYASATIHNNYVFFSICFVTGILVSKIMGPTFKKIRRKNDE